MGTTSMCADRSASFKDKGTVESGVNIRMEGIVVNGCQGHSLIVSAQSAS